MYKQLEMKDHHIEHGQTEATSCNIKKGDVLI